MLGGYLVDTITYARQSGSDANGDPAFGTAQTAAARVEYATKLVIGPTGNQIQCDAVVATEVELRTTDRVWLSTDDIAGAARRPLLVKYATTPRGRENVETPDLRRR